LGAADRVLHDGQTVIGVRQNQVLAWDSDMRASILLDDTRPYRYVYLEELLLAEKQIQLQDIEGDWLAEDGHTLVIEKSGVSRGYLVFDEGEPLPFYVVYAAHDRMKLMIADLTHRSVDVSLQADGRLHLAASDGMSKVYLRGGQDADAPERL
jgi:hypothetical protein